LNGTLFDTQSQGQIRAKIARDFCCEGNLMLLACLDVDAMDLASPCDEDIFAVGREGVAGQEVAGEQRFLVVALHRVLEPVFFRSFHVADAEAGLSFVAGAVDEFVAVGGNHRAEGAAGRVGDNVFFSRDAVAARNL
jgi:hypothetical protein